MAMIPAVPVPPLAPTIAPLGDDLRALFSRISSLGFRHVQLSTTRPGAVLRPRDLDRSARRDLLATLRRHELELAGLDCWIPVVHFTDARHADRAVAALTAAIDLAADLGRVTVSTMLPSSKSPSDKPDEADPAIDASGILQAIADHASSAGVVIADHATPIVPHSYRGVLDVGIDCVAALSAKSSPAALMHTHVGRVAAIRISDVSSTGQRQPLGERDGQLDLLEVRVAASLAMNNRPVVLDCRQWIDPWTGLQQSLEAWNA